MVEYGLPKPGVRVRFPLPAPAQEQRLFCSYFSSILRWKKNICITPCSFASDKKLVSLPLFIGDARFTRADRCKGNFALLFYTKSFAVSLAPSLFRKKSRYATNFLRGSLRSHWFVQRLFCSYFSSILR